MSDFKKLFQAKRILAMFLAAAMVVTMLPTTASAATVNPTVTEEAQEETDVSTPETESVTVPEETTSVQTEVTDETVPATDGTETPAVTETETGDPVADTAEGETTVLVTEIETINLSNSDTKKTYAEGVSNPFANALNNIKTYTDVYVNGEYKAELCDKLSYKWQVQGADGTYTDLAAATVPVNVGKYKLVISIDKIDGVCESATKEVDFEIEKAVVQLANLNTIVEPGSTVKEFVDGIIKDYSIENSAGNELDKATYVKDIKVEVKDALTGTVAAEDAVFVNNSDYVAVITVTLNDNFTANYCVPGYEAGNLNEIKISVTSLIDTEVKVTNTLENAGKVISKVYDGKDLDVKTVVEPNITVEVVTPDVLDETTGKSAVIKEATYESLEKVWVDANHIELGKDKVPVDAGTYYLVLKYAGKDGVYAASENEIKVVVEPAQLIIEPLEIKDTIYTGMTEQEVLKKVDYVLHEIDENGKAKTEEYKIDRNTFWGVSYMDKTKNQAYEPVFKLQYATKDKDGNLVKDQEGNVIYQDNNDAELVSATPKTEGATAKVYRVVFAGKKTVYNANGTAVDTRDVNAADVNSAEPNYTISLDEKAIADNAKDITVVDAIETKIDVSAILKEGKGATYTDPIKTIYSGSEIYADRAEYKKAVVKKVADDTEVVKNEDLDISYRWEQQTGTTFDKDDNEVPVWSDIHQTNVYAPENVGTYRLHIRYSDPDCEYAPSEAEVIYEILPQYLSVVPSGEYKVYTGTSTYDFVSKIEDEISYEIYKLKDNNYNPKELGDKLVLEKDEDGNLWFVENGIKKNYRLQWFIERETKDDTGKNTGEWEAYSGVFAEEYNYRLAVKITGISGNNYTDHTTEEQADKTEKTIYFNEALNLQVVPMGETEIEITINPEKLPVRYKMYDGETVDTAVEGFVTITKKTDGSVVTDIPAEEIVYTWYDTDSDITQTEVRNAGSYELTVSFAGNDKYKYAYAQETDVITIAKRPITITPTVAEGIVAGEKVGYVTVYDITNVKVEGYAPADEAAFTYGSYTYETTSNGEKVTKTAYGYTAWDRNGWFNSYPVIYKKDNNNRVPNGERFRGNTVYEVEQQVSRFNYPYSINYSVTYNRAEFTPVRANATVEGAWDEYDALSTALRDTVEGSKHTIVPSEGIPFVQDEDYFEDISGKSLVGNYFVFEITAPEEFNDDYNYYSGYSDFFGQFVFENSIKAAGGHIVYTDADDGEIYVAFDAAKDKNETAKSFDIRWEEGYVETFTVDLTKALLEDDFTKAVAPKSLAFNGADTKMAVGETQQLDVKVKKEQINDIICLDYKADNDKVLSVTDKGYVTALGKGTATVTVYPSVLVEGKKVHIKGAKTASVKITVTDVVVPAVKKVTATDTKVTVQYADPANGYRREFYVLEGKNIKATEFETKISEMKNGAWEGIFAIAPVFGDGTLDTKTKIRTITLRGLNPTKDYTVYVRNVSGVRTLDDGTQVATNAVGTVKSFATTKSKVVSLEVDIKRNTTVPGNDSNANTTGTTVKLSEKTVQAVTKGTFYEDAEKDSADFGDTVQYELPLSKDKQNYYVNPKLTYAVGDYETNETIAKKYGYTVKVGNRYFAPSSIATINKSGKITLKGVGTVDVYAYDSDTGIWSDGEKLTITAEATSVTGKKAKVKAGEPVWLGDLLEYKEGTTKLKGNVPQNLFIEDLSKVNNEAFTVVRIGAGYGLIAKKAGTIEIPITDLNVKAAGGNADTTIKITSAAIAPVKNLKVAESVDNYADITFTYSSDADYIYGLSDGDVVAFSVDLKDNRGKLVRNELLYVSENDDFADEYENNNIIFEGDILERVDYNAKGNTYTFRYRLYDLTRLSNYKVSVTAVYGDEVSKAANVKVKTTDIPASYNDLGKEKKGGIGIYVETINGSGYALSDYPYFTSGNTYTLEAWGANYTALSRTTDTLTWKSTNTKVATVKANAGTYFATLKAVKSGTTTIEVTSKITKKVIARYPVYVKAVGQADDFFGDYDVDFISWDPSYANGVEVLTAANPVSVRQNARDYKWVSFTAPEFGIYSFNNAYINEYRDANGNRIRSYDGVLAKGEKIYLKIFGSFTVSVSSNKIQSLTTASSVRVNSNVANVIAFKALEDNYYTFSSANNGTGFVSGIYKATGSRVNYSTTSTTAGYQYGVALDAGDEIFLYVQPGNYTVNVKSRENTVLSATPTAVTVQKDEEKWFIFTAPETGAYTFKSEGATALVKADYYTSIKNATSTYSLTQSGEKDFAQTINIAKDTTVAVKVYTEEETATANVSVTPKENLSVEVNKPVEVNLGASESQWVTFKAATEGIYKFDVNGADSTSYYKNGISNANAIYSYSNCELEAGDVVYINVQAPAVIPLAEETENKVKVTVNVTKIEATALTDGTPSGMTLKDGSEYWYSFTAPVYGKYVFRTDVTANETGATHSVSVQKYSQVGGSYSESFGTYAEKVLKAGDKVVLKVTANTAGADVTTSASISVTKANFEQFTTDTPASLDIAKGGVKWYSFTASKDGKYTFKKDLTEGAADIYSAIDSIENSFGLILDGLNTETVYILKAGQTIYFKAAQSGDTASKGKITVSTPVVTPFTGTATAIVKKDTAQWYTYTVPKTGRYFITYSVKEEGVAANVEMYDSLDAVYTQSISTNGNFFNGGKTLYFKLSTAADTATVTLNVNGISAETLTAGTAVETKVKSGADKWYKFTVPSDGRYELSLTPNEGSYVYKEVFDSNARYTVSDLTDKYYLKKDTEYYVRAYADADTEQTAKLEVKALPITGAFSMEAETSVELKAGETKWYTFTAEEDGRYTFSTDATEDITVSAETYINIENGAAYYDMPIADYSLNKGENILLGISASKDATFKVKVEKKDVTPVTVGENEVTIKKGETKYFSFKAYNEGRYAFKSAGLPKDTELKVSGGLWSSMSPDGFFVSKYVREGNEVEFGVMTSSETDTTFKIVVERILPTTKELSLEKPLAMNMGKIEHQYVSFTAPEDGRYTIKSDSDAVTVNYWECYENGNESYSSYGVLPTEVALHEGDTILYKVTYTSATDAATATFNLTVSKVEPVAITETSTSVELEVGAAKWYSYTATENGTVTFASEISDSYFEVYTDIAGNRDRGSYNSVSKIMRKGDTVYLCVRNRGSAKATIDVNVTVDAMTALTTGSNEITSSTTGYKWFSYAVEKTGVYSFSSNNEFYYYGNNPNGSYSYNNVLLEKNSTVYMKIYCYADETLTVNVTLGQEINLVVLEQGVPVETSVAAGGDSWFVFTAPSDGTYRFYSTGQYDTYVILYKDGQELGSNDDDGSGNNFYYETWLDEGDKIYLDTFRYNHGSEAITYTVYADRID